MLQYAKHIMEKKEEQRSSIRKRNLLVLINSFFLQNGYLHSAETLRHESATNFDNFSVCDNIDLEIILQEFETFQYVKFRHYPHLVKKVAMDTSTSQPYGNKRPVSRVRPVSKTLSSNHLPSTFVPESHRDAPVRGPKKESPLPDSGKQLPKIATKASESELSVEGTKFAQPVTASTSLKSVPATCRTAEALKTFSPKRALPDYNSEWQHLIEVISKDIFSDNTNVCWKDIVGLDTAKRLVKEAVVFPIKFPDLFSGILSPWKGLLLFGPPGNGKTLLAKAVATECKTTFFNISATTIVSKWRGDSEKLVRVLFELARLNAPSTIFLDEMDALICKRETQGNNEHEASRRMKTELLVQMDGLANSNDLVFVLAATNVPWDLDHAVLRRLEKRILVPLPNEASRRNMFQQFLPQERESRTTLPVGKLDYDLLAQRTEGYSGADIRLVCKESAMQAVRKVLLQLDAIETDDERIMEMLQPVVTNDVLASISCTKPSAKGLAAKYDAWNGEYGSA